MRIFKGIVKVSKGRFHTKKFGTIWGKELKKKKNLPALNTFSLPINKMCTCCQNTSIIIAKRSWSNLQSEKPSQFALTSDELLAGSFTVPFPQASNRNLGRGSFLRGLVLFFSLLSALSIGELSLRSPGCSSEPFWLSPFPTCSVPGISTMFPQS